SAASCFSVRPPPRKATAIRAKARQRSMPLPLPIRLARAGSGAKAMATTPQAPPPQQPTYVPRRHRSLFGPVVLIGLGIVFLLVNMGVFHWHLVGIAFAKYWPLFIILWGIVKLFEHMQARKHGLPPPGIGAGGVFLLLLLMFFGGIASAAYH